MIVFDATQAPAESLPYAVIVKASAVLEQSMYATFVPYVEDFNSVVSGDTDESTAPDASLVRIAGAPVTLSESIVKVDVVIELACTPRSIVAPAASLATKPTTIVSLVAAAAAIPAKVSAGEVASVPA